MRKHAFTLSLLLLLATLLVACGGGEQTPSSSGAKNATPTATPVFVDNNGTPLAVPAQTPSTIVSLLPNTSELVAAIGLESKLAAVDFYTNYPTSLSSKPKVSDASMKYNVEQIVALKPDLVLTYGGETQQVNDQLKALNLKVVDLPLGITVRSSLDLIIAVGRVTRQEDAALRLYDQLSQKLSHLNETAKKSTSKKALIELDYSTPGKPFIFGGSSFGDSMLMEANAENVFHSNTTNKGYPQVTDEAIIAANPQYIFTTAYGENEATIGKRPNWQGVAAVAEKHVYALNPDLLSRAGPRLVQGVECLAFYLHPTVFTGSMPSVCSVS